MTCGCFTIAGSAFISALAYSAITRAGISKDAAAIAAAVIFVLLILAAWQIATERDLKRYAPTKPGGGGNGGGGNPGFRSYFDDDPPPGLGAAAPMCIAHRSNTITSADYNRISRKVRQPAPTQPDSAPQPDGVPSGAPIAVPNWPVREPARRDS